MARSTTKNPKNRLQCVQTKLIEELESLEKWENNWKIKVNPNKCTIDIRSSHIMNLELLGGMQINNIQVSLNNNIKILGYNFSHDRFLTCHIDNICKRAKTEISKLYRFNTAPQKIKKTPLPNSNEANTRIPVCAVIKHRDHQYQKITTDTEQSH